MALSSRPLLLLAVIAAAGRPLAAQSRATLADSDPRAQLMGYYSAAMQFTPVGMPDRAGRLEIGGAATLIPSLSLADRTVGFGGTKPENSNLCAFYPRLAAARGFGSVSVEAGWTPPVAVCGVKANVVSAAASVRFVMSPRWNGYLRLSGTAGHLDAAITCSARAVADSLDQTCFKGSPSADRVAPAAFGVDFAAAWQGWQARHIEPYVTVGVRYERVDFDVNYTRTDAQGTSAPPLVPPLDDHQQLRATLGRIQMAAGASWVVGRCKLGGELYYAPGALLTLRGRAAVLLGSGR